MNNPPFQPLVSVIINCHNSEKYLLDAMQSIYDQTYENWEIIFWDNASTDRSAKIALSFDSKVRYFFSDKKANLGTARNAALGMANGEFVGFLDCDDLWSPLKLEQQLDYFRINPDLGFVYSKAYIIDAVGQQKNIIPRSKDLSQGSIFSLLIHENFIPFPSVLFSKEKLIKLGGVPCDLFHSTDYSIFLSLSKNHPVVGINSPMCSYRIHENNLSNSQKLLGVIENISILKKYLPSSEIKRALQNHFATLVIESFRAQDFQYLNSKVFFEHISISAFIFRFKNRLTYWKEGR